jgi:sensor histidine kinase YesM
MTLLHLKSFFKKHKLHFLIWGLYILYEVFILGLVTGQFRPIGAYILIYVTNISVFYSNGYLSGKALKSDDNIPYYIKLPLIILFSLFAYILVSFMLVMFFGVIGLVEKQTLETFDRKFVLACIYRSSLFIGYSIGYIYILKYLEDRKKVEALERQSLVTQIEKQALENDLVQSQNNFLRSQINPHFLFNTLNFIYNDARKKAPMAADAIMNLAEMMRYALKRPEASEMVPLSEEVEQIEHLINLHQLRTANAINLNLEVNGDLFGLRFPPLILLTLVENIFKHGNVTHSTQPAIIKIDYENNNLNISTINMVNDNKGKELESHHVGIDNINKRLANFYKDDYIFRYYKDPLNRYITEIDVQVINPMSKLNLNQ